MIIGSAQPRIGLKAYALSSNEATVFITYTTDGISPSDTTE